MRRQKAVLLGELFGEFLKSEGLEQGIKRMEVFEAWDTAVGERISELTTEKFYKDGRLFCKISSSVARTQLFTQRVEIIKKINDIMGSKIVKEIIFK
ncbi:MAG: DUF721 domain-containing protein [Bacteroidales bacterium]|jgi:predicted nucleic acid-binding Zn ribbon protein|nr:DUF721 domain-containing protein [Bacteroidales bacterium]